MKLKSYFLLSIVVGMTFACSSDENVPEVEVFTPDATLSLAAVADGKSLTKAGEGEGENIDQEDAINSLHVMVFYADGNLNLSEPYRLKKALQLCGKHVTSFFKGCSMFVLKTLHFFRKLFHLFGKDVA